MKTDFDIPATVAVCPHCGGKLMLEVDEWLEDGEPTEAGCHVSCVDEPEDEDHFPMPYVTLLPIEAKVYAWARQHIRVCESEEELREMLRAWNAGEPLPGGMWP